MHPQAEQESVFLGHVLLGGLDLEIYLVVLDRLSRGRLKRSSTFWRKKVHPRRNPGYAYEIHVCLYLTIYTLTCMYFIY